MTLIVPIYHDEPQLFFLIIVTMLTAFVSTDVQHGRCDFTSVNPAHLLSPTASRDTVHLDPNIFLQGRFKMVGVISLNAGRSECRLWLSLIGWTPRQCVFVGIPLWTWHSNQIMAGIGPIPVHSSFPIWLVCSGEYLPTFLWDTPFTQYHRNYHNHNFRAIFFLMKLLLGTFPFKPGSMKSY